jgi:ornithine cyclodeaminase/alanine dehydrogenase-like protein (mu-crystallin family)
VYGGPNFDHALALCRRLSERHGIPTTPMPSAFEAVKGAKIVCTVTSAREPVLMGDWLMPGVHVNAIGASVPTARELDTNAVAKSLLFVDRRESALHEAGDFLIPKREGVIGDSHIRGEIGEILSGQVSGRQTDQDITLFKSLGLAVEDIVSAYRVYRKALEKGLGTWVEFS